MSSILLQIYNRFFVGFLWHFLPLRNFLAGILIACGFAPAHLPGLAFLGLSLFFSQLNQKISWQRACLCGFELGLGCMTFGVSWIYVSIHLYGNLNMVLSLLATLIFLMYLALFPAFMALVYNILNRGLAITMSCLLFCALWTLQEYLRATIFGGFPWLMLGVSQMDTPLNNLLPMIGIYGVGFYVCLAACCLSIGVQHRQLKLIVVFVLIILSPLCLSSIKWAKLDDKPLAVSVVQVNMSMRNKWSEKYFWHLVDQYQVALNKLMGKATLIVLPESALPVPPDYIQDLLDDIDQKAKAAGSAILIGIPQTATKSQYYNTMMSFGAATGMYFKQHLVPFGEFTPPFLQTCLDWLGVPAANMLPHKALKLVKVQGHKIASLICYELAYPQLLRQQLPAAEWIVSISDDGWFGHSFAMYQQLQMSQVLAKMTARFHVVANNDGLSSVIDQDGQIIASLPTFSSDILDS